MLPTCLNRSSFQANAWGGNRRTLSGDGGTPVAFLERRCPRSPTYVPARRECDRAQTQSCCRGDRLLSQT